MPRPRNTARRQQQIIDALGRLMVQEGYAGATIQAVARAAGLSSPGLVHYHFPSKQAILMALVAQVSERLERRLAALAAPTGEPWRDLDAMIHAILSPAEGDPALAAQWSALGAEAAKGGAVQLAYTETVSGVMRRLLPPLEAVVKREGAPLEQAPAMAAALLAAMEGVFQMARSAPGLFPEGEGAPMVCRMARGLVRGAT